MKNRHLHILWTNADVTTANLMVMMYAKNSLRKGWWDAVTVIIWGKTAQFAAENEEIQGEIAQCRELGVTFSGCITCAKELDVVEKLEALNIELIPWGPPLTALIEEKQPLLTI